MRVLPDPYILAFLLVDGVLLLLLFSRLTSALRAGAACFRSSYGTEEMLGNNFLCGSVQRACLLLLPLFAATLVVTDVSAAGFWWTLVLLLALLLFRRLACLAIGWLSSRQAAFRSLEIMGLAVLVLVMFASLPAFLAGWLLPRTPRWLLWGYLAVVAAAGLGVYVWRGSSMILQTRFSICFWVLYLCGLEFLPICVVANFLINGN